jgi:hypothetical protein
MWQPLFAGLLALLMSYRAAWHGTGI